ncbi:DUF4154 domain-containing protein [bacterium]|nr:DUF4154 domain-containing protein [bacterium]
MKLVIGFILSLLAWFPAQNPMDVDEATHVEMIIKSLSYDSKINGGTVLVISRSGSNANSNNVASTLSGKSIKKVPVELFQLEFVSMSSLDPIVNGQIKVDLVYLCNDLTNVQLAQLNQFCTRNKIVSATGVAKFVEDGYACLSVIKEEGKVKPLVNLEKLKSLDHAFSSSYLKLCKIL